MIPAGTRVKPSQYVLRPLRDAWLGEGSHSRKSLKKQWLDDKAAERGTVTANTKTAQGYPSLSVQWDSGAISHCLPYMVEPA